MSDTFHYTNTTLGVLGGMGPITSTRFISTIYQLCQETDEFAMPKIRLISEPDIPDRTQSIKASDTALLEERLCSLLESMSSDTDRMLICCFTAHAVVSQLPEDIQEKLINLVSYSNHLLKQLDQKTLFIATEGVHEIELFPLEQYQNVVRLQKDDLKKVHHLIYTYLKNGRNYEFVEEQFRSLLETYHCTQIFGGCTEMHLLKMWDRSTLRIVDPLFEIASEFAGCNAEVL
jgi:aspartate racemase